MLASLLDFLIASVILVGLMFYYGFRLTAGALWVVPAMLTLTVFLTGIALFTSALQTRFRALIDDGLPLLLQVWMLSTPIVYSRVSVPQGYRPWYDLNPLVAIIETFRSALLHGRYPDPMLQETECVAISILVAAVSYAWFKDVEATMMDVI